jgi:serine/threonine protein kinase
MERYRLENEIGEGAFGTVFRALKISNGQEVSGGFFALWWFICGICYARMLLGCRLVRGNIASSSTMLSTAH